MTYYKVRAKYDFKSRHFKGKKTNYIYGFYKENELLTKKEYEKIADSPYIFEVVTIPKNQTYKQFYSSLNEFKRFSRV